MNAISQAYHGPGEEPVVFGLLSKLAWRNKPFIRSHHEDLRAALLGICSIRHCLNVAADGTIAWSTAEHTIYHEVSLIHRTLQRYHHDHLRQESDSRDSLWKSTSRLSIAPDVDAQPRGYVTA